MNPWWGYIEEARKAGGKFTRRMKDLAWRPETCAVGEATGGRHDLFTDQVHENRMFSGRFTRAVETDEVDLAEETLIKIEDEVLRMKREGLL